MERRNALEALVRLTNEKLGFEPTTPSELNELLMRIQKTTGQTLSLSSVKRVWGYVKYSGSFSTTTLNILARFNGVKDWETFKTSIEKEVAVTNDEDSGFHSDTMIDTGKYRPGDKIELSWDAGKGCELECVGHLRFRVVKSFNIKLKEGDLVTLHTLCIGHPVHVSDIVRDDVHFTSYVGAKNSGLRSVREIR